MAAGCELLVTSNFPYAIDRELSAAVGRPLARATASRSSVYSCVPSGTPLVQRSGNSTEAIELLAWVQSRAASGWDLP
jgi:hypothetical protein